MATITLLSWNVNGIRAVQRAGFMDWLAAAGPDILCLQETRAEPAQLPVELQQVAGYQTFWNPSAGKRGYSGTALLTRQPPLAVRFGLGTPEFDGEGRTIIAEYDSFVLINCYFPNGSRDHSRVLYKLAFYEAFLQVCEGMRSAGQTVLFCGDVNTAHNDIDLARPRANQNTSGFLREERDWLDELVAHGYVDTFRHFYPDLAGQYTWWSQVTHGRDRNIGWRLDYFWAAAEVLPRLAGAFILPEVRGSDHCPVGLQLVV